MPQPQPHHATLTRELVAKVKTAGLDLVGLDPARRAECLGRL